MVAGVGFEPTTFGLWARRAAWLLYPATLRFTIRKLQDTSYKIQTNSAPVWLLEFEICLRFVSCILFLLAFGEHVDDGGVEPPTSTLSV